MIEVSSDSDHEHPLQIIPQRDGSWNHLVVHCKDSKFDVYIGRPYKEYPTEKFTWRNPFIINSKSREARAQSIKKYKAWLYND